jgi:hypothetical protein
MNSIPCTTLTLDSSKLKLFIQAKINPILNISHTTNYSLDFNSSTLEYPKNKSLRTYNLTGRLKANGAYYFIYNFLSLTNSELSQAIDLFYDNCQEAIDKDKDNYLAKALKENLNPNRKVDWKISMIIEPDKISN